MGYKLLGFVVWQGGKWYLRRQARQHQRELAFAIGGLAAIALAGAAAGVLVSQRRSEADTE